MYSPGHVERDAERDAELVPALSGEPKPPGIRSQIEPFRHACVEPEARIGCHGENRPGAEDVRPGAQAKQSGLAIIPQAYSSGRKWRETARLRQRPQETRARTRRVEAPFATAICRLGIDTECRGDRKRHRRSDGRSPVGAHCDKRCDDKRWPVLRP